MFDCPHCSNQLPDGAAFCNQCWRPVDDPPRLAADPAATAEAPTSAASALPPPPVPDDRPVFTPAPGGPPPPEGDDVTSAYPPMPPPQPQTSWASGEPTSAPAAAPGWGAPPPAAPGWGQPQPPPGSADPQGYGAPAQSGYGPPPGYGYSAPPPGYAPQAPYGYPQPGYYGYAVPTGPGTNGMAIAALVSAIAGWLLSCGLLAPLGIVFGHISISQIKRTGESGRGMAIAGLVMGYLSLAAIVGFIVLAVASSGTS